MTLWHQRTVTSELAHVAIVVMVFVIRTEELGEDDISFKMINENATLVRGVVISTVVIVTMLLGARTTGLGQET